MDESIYYFSDARDLQKRKRKEKRSLYGGNLSLRNCKASELLSIKTSKINFDSKSKNNKLQFTFAIIILVWIIHGSTNFY